MASAGTITFVDPDTVTAGGPAFTLTVHGSGFAAINTSVYVGGGAMETTYVSATELRATVLTSVIADPGILDVQVRRTGPFDPSNIESLTVIAAVPDITGTTPTELIISQQKILNIASDGTFLPGVAIRLWPPLYSDDPYTPPVTFLTASLVRITVIASWVPQTGNLTVQAVNPGGVEGNVFTVPVVNPTPTINSISPSVVTPGSGTFTLTVIGSGFVATSKVRWNGGDLTTVGTTTATQIQANVPGTYVAVGSPPTANIKVNTPAPGGGNSNALTLYIGSAAAVPVLTSVSPTNKTVGDLAFTLTANGSGYIASSVVRWAGSDRPTTLASPTQLTAQIAASDLVSPGTVPITVYTPPPGGGTSVARSFTVYATNPVPSITMLSPPSVAAGSAQFDLTVSGLNFVAAAVVKWNAVTLATVSVTSNEIVATVPASYVLTAGAALVSVTNPAPGGGTSPNLTFTITDSGEAEVPHIDDISPTWQVMGYGSNVTLTVQGSNFDSTSVIRWWVGVNDFDDLTTNVTQVPDTLSATLTPTRFAVEGAFDVTVYTPPPGGGTSNAIPFAVNSAASNPVPRLDSITPTEIVRGTDPEPTLILAGSRFVPESTVVWGNNEREPSYIHSGRLELVVASGDIAALPGVVLRMNARSHSAAQSASARTMHVLASGDVHRPALTVGAFGDSGFYQPEPGVLAISAGGSDVGRFMGSTSTSVGFATPEASRVPPWIEPETVASAATTINTTAATDITGTTKIITPACDVRVEVKACFDATMTVAGAGFIGELFVNGAARPEKAVYTPSTVNERATVFQVWNFTILGGVATTLKLTGRLGIGTGTFSIGTHTKYSLFGVGRY